MSRGGDSALLTEVSHALLAGSPRCTSSDEAHVDLQSVTAAALCALHRLDQAELLCSGIRKKLLSSSGGNHARLAWWCLTDMLIKHQPMVFGPLLWDKIDTLLGEAIDRATEGLDAAKVARPDAYQSAVDTIRWFERLILGWRGALPEAKWQQLRKYLAQKRAHAELLNAAIAASSDDKSTVPSDQQEASPQQLALLQEKLDAFKALVDSLMKEHRREQVNVPVAVAERPDAVAQAAAAASSTPQDANVTDQGDDEDDEYQPDFVAGGAVREKPQEAIIKREPRKRTRPVVDDDYY